MVRAGNSLRGHLLQALVQARASQHGQIGNRFGGGPVARFGQGVSQRQKLQALLARVQQGHGTGFNDPNVEHISLGGSQNPNVSQGGQPHGFGPGGAVTGHDPANAVGSQPIHPPMQPIGGGPAPDNFHMPPGLDPMASNALRNDHQHARDLYNMGDKLGGAKQWEAHHPGAVAAGHIPDWVMEGLTNALHSASGGPHGLQPTHIQTILQHLSQAMAPAQLPHIAAGGGMPGGDTLQPPPQSYN